MIPQEKFWAGEFGDDYTDRNTSDDLLTNNMVFFGDILPKAKGVQSILEFGCNAGLNLAAIRALNPRLELTGVDVNRKALSLARESVGDKVSLVESTIAGYQGEDAVDLVMTKGVLIHIAPEQLADVYDKLYAYTKKYILICEYYSRRVQDLLYRGHTARMWKRDFAGEIMDRHSLELVDYGFTYHRAEFPQDDIHWFLLRRQ